tara:strand:+ start:721 stop:1515 length:795 start_codon:yes stop_codon:yes gene_type:complete
MAKSKANSDHFDPADQVQVIDMANGETGELLPSQKTPDSAWQEDTIADPVGVEERNAPTSISLPDYYFKKYSLDGEGNATFNSQRVEGIMKVFESKKNTPMSFLSKDEDKVKEDTDFFLSQVAQVVEGQRPLLEIDPQSSGINFLQLTTRTWAEFASIAYEYQEDSEAVNQSEELPTWLIEREDKMFGLGRKARLLSAAVEMIGEDFGLSDISLNSKRVQTEVERRQQRLAAWNYKNAVNISHKVASDMNRATLEHTKSVFDAA